MYKHIEYTDEYITLHDCKAEEMRYNNNILSFVFPDGFWIMSEHKYNESDNIVRTDVAQVEFEVIDDEIEIYVFDKNSEGKIIREEWGLKNLIHSVNSGDLRIEFADEYKGFESVLFKGYLWSDIVPYSKEYELILHIKNATYMWNEIQYDRIW